MKRWSVIAAILVGTLALAAEPKAATAIVLGDRAGEAVPVRSGCTYVGGGTIDVKQPAADTVVLTLVGAVVATGHPHGSSAVMEFDVDQAFEVTGGRCKLSLESEIVGVLRGGRIAAAWSNAGAAVTGGEATIVAADLPDRCVTGGENLTVNDKAAPDDVAVAPGSYHIRSRWRLAATHPAGLRGKSSSAEFAPEPALDPLWVGGPRDPFHGVVKKDFGMRITVKVTPLPPEEPVWKSASAALRR
jgi:hypothetical protein